jgi:hypothetical protein
VTPGGITDRLLGDYPNMFGDCSAGSGLNADLTRIHAGFLTGIRINWFSAAIAGIRLVRFKMPGRANPRRDPPVRANKAIERKILYENARKLLKV